MKHDVADEWRRAFRAERLPTSQHDDVAKTGSPEQLLTGKAILVDPFPGDVLNRKLARQSLTLCFSLEPDIGKQLSGHRSVEIAGNAKLEGHGLDAGQMRVESAGEVERDLHPCIEAFVVVNVEQDRTHRDSFLCCVGRYSPNGERNSGYIRSE